MILAVVVSLEFKYDEDGNRVEKITNDVKMSYAYDEDGNLISETSEDRNISYLYEFSEEDFKYYMSGFVYEGETYDYQRENGIITGISKNGEVLALYQYNGDCFVSTLGKDGDGNWIDMTDDECFIGNINPIRWGKSYWDEETGWYYCGRYYSAELRRFIDGIDFMKAEELKLYYPEYEVNAKIYTEGINLSGKAREVLDPVTVVARVLRLESWRYTNDQDCVAWVIYNRMKSNNSDFELVTTAYDVVTQKDQFITYTSPEFNNLAPYLDYGFNVFCDKQFIQQ